MGDGSRGVCRIDEQWLVGRVDWVVEDERQNVSRWDDRRRSHRKEAHIRCSVCSLSLRYPEVEEKDSLQNRMKSREGHYVRAGTGSDARLLTPASVPAANDLAYFGVSTVEFGEQ